LNLNKRTVLVLVVALALAAWPLVFRQGYALTLATRTLALIVFVLSYHLLYGRTGLLSFGHALYFGAGAFCAAHALNAWGARGLPVTLLPMLGGAGGALVAALPGWINARRGGLAFAMISLGLAELALAAAPMLPALFGGEAGIATNRVTGPRWFDNWLGIDYASGTQVYELVLAWTLASAGAMAMLSRTPLGCMALAVRDNAERASFLGADPRTVRWRMLILAGFFAGVAGALSTIQYEVATVEALGRVQSAAPLVAAVIGGPQSFGGAIGGAVVYELAAGGLSSLTPAWPFYLGCLFVLVMLVAPRGLAGLWKTRLPKQGVTTWIASLIAAGGLVTVVELAYLYSGSGQASVLAQWLGLPGREHSAGAWGLGLLTLVGGAALCRLAVRPNRTVAELPA